MKIGLSVLGVAFAASMTLASPALASPASGAAIAGIAHAVDPAIGVATTKKTAAAKKCPPGQELSTKTGKCRAPTSEEK
jgi:hypothetical protein